MGGRIDRQTESLPFAILPIRVDTALKTKGLDAKYQFDFSFVFPLYNI